MDAAGDFAMNAALPRRLTTCRIRGKATHPALPLLTVCAWCKRVRDPRSGRWIAPAESLGTVTHGICPACQQQQMRALATAS